MPRPGILVRAVTMSLVILLAALTLTASLVADAVRSMLDGVAEQSPVLQVAVLDRPPPATDALLDDERFDRLLALEHQRAGDLYLWRGNLLADAQRWDEAAFAYRMARDYGALHMDDSVRLRWAEALVNTYQDSLARDLLREIDLTIAAPQDRASTLVWLDRLDERSRRVGSNSVPR